MTDPEGPDSFHRIAVSFHQNLKALRVFCDRIGQAADEHDESLIDGFSASLTDLFGFNPRDEDAESEDETPTETVDGEAEPGSDEGISEEKKEEISQILEDPQARRTLIDTVSSFLQAAPVQGQILRKGALMILVSYFEALVSDLIHGFYSRYPAALPASDRTLTLAEIRDLGSLEEAEEHIVAREVESVLRESITQQIEYFGKRPSLRIDPIQPEMPYLLEIGQRRNLFVHNANVVNRIYLKKVPFREIGMEPPELDSSLYATAEYLSKATCRIEIVGSVLIDLCWRKWDSDDIQGADGTMASVMYKALDQERYESAIFLARYLTNEAESVAPAVVRTALVNQAIALQRTGKDEAADRLIEEKDWTDTSPRFKVAVAALRHDKDTMLAEIPKALAAEDLEVEHLKEWPLFDEFRDDDGFVRLVDEASASEAGALLT